MRFRPNRVHNWKFHVLYLLVIIALSIRVYGDHRKLTDAYDLLWQTNRLVSAGIGSQSQQSALLQDGINATFCTLEAFCKLGERPLYARQADTLRNRVERVEKLLDNLTGQMFRHLPKHDDWNVAPALRVLTNDQAPRQAFLPKHQAVGDSVRAVWLLMRRLAGNRFENSAFADEPALDFLKKPGMVTNALWQMRKLQFSLRTAEYEAMSNLAAQAGDEIYCAPHRLIVQSDTWAIQKGQRFRGSFWLEQPPRMPSCATFYLNNKKLERPGPEPPHFELPTGRVGWNSFLAEVEVTNPLTRETKRYAESFRYFVEPD